MSLFKAGHPEDVKATIGARARDAAAAAVPQARRAGTSAVHGVMQGVESARGWAAPRLDQAADMFSETVAPRVSSAMHSTASKVAVAPAPASKTGIRRLLDWRLLLGIGAALAAAGAAAAMTMRKRYTEATYAASEDAEMDTDLNQKAPMHDQAGPKSEGKPKSEVNGQVGTARR